MGDEAVKFAARAGLFLDPWQQDVLRGALGVRAGGKWTARNVALLVPRQNGKGSVLEALELFAMFVLETPLIIHSAHKFDTSQEHFLRMQHLIDGNPDLSKHVASVYTANGKESITLKNGCRLKFKARTVSGSGRGFSCDILVLDEAMILPEQALAAMSPSMTARPNPQTWFTSSAGTPESTALWRLVEQGRKGASRLAYFEWGCPQGVDPEDRQAWAQANPGLGFRLSVDELENELATLSPEDFAREHLGIWDDQASAGIFGPGVWERLEDPGSQLVGNVTFAVEIAENRQWACVAAAGAGRPAVNHVEVVEYRPDTSWLLPRLLELAGKHPTAAVVVQPSAQAGSLIPALEDARVRVVKPSQQQYAAACGMFHDTVVAGDLRHLGHGELDFAVRAARKKLTSDAWVWNRRNETSDISPLAAVTLALWGHATSPPVDLWAGVF